MDNIVGFVFYCLFSSASPVQNCGAIEVSKFISEQHCEAVMTKAFRIGSPMQQGMTHYILKRHNAHPTENTLNPLLQCETRDKMLEKMGKAEEVLQDYIQKEQAPPTKYHGITPVDIEDILKPDLSDASEA